MIYIKEFCEDEITRIDQIGGCDVVPCHTAIIGADDVLFGHSPAVYFIEHFDIDNRGRIDQWGIDLIW